ncbi:RicAFT regulatory complex protein RicA family protein [Paenactinomyces guangxiensis]|uniref:YlbF family regulator n=1 Tax=Paenactinomyces guangxiensis TaxID=1490290 RepID=A0A7W1WQZ6_9BACL|nr:YlbF family regulator [Paenactinomyces guangxiensis]MBA4494436.1 YlbF family regulator [Paenactinomyces guangxiensis]MBH8591509.1 YlbF family regulator [Paenactinomyces guangxiensis]
MASISTEHPILLLAGKLANRLQECEEIRRFRLAEEQVKNSKTVQNYIETIKRKQKELVHAKHFQKTGYIRQLEQELERLNDELEHLPIVREYQQSQVDANDLLQTIQRIVADTVSTKICVETGGEDPGGCGSGGPCGCKSK